MLSAPSLRLPFVARVGNHESKDSFSLRPVLQKIKASCPKLGVGDFQMPLIAVVSNVVGSKLRHLPDSNNVKVIFFHLYFAFLKPWN
jgi:hypothetical protein